jgi:hypothetical protein
MANGGAGLVNIQAEVLVIKVSPLVAPRAKRRCSLIMFDRSLRSPDICRGPTHTNVPEFTLAIFTPLCLRNSNRDGCSFMKSRILQQSCHSSSTKLSHYFVIRFLSEVTYGEF